MKSWYPIRENCVLEKVSGGTGGTESFFFSALSLAKLARFPLLHRHLSSNDGTHYKIESNEQAWNLFNKEHIYDTSRLTLEHFHLFEWFPLSPGLFHAPHADRVRSWGSLGGQYSRSPEGTHYLNAHAKMMMLEAGVGSVRLQPRVLGGSHIYYFLTASSSEICHEGFPVVVPRRFYSGIKRYILEYGAVPVTISGEMRYIPKDDMDFMCGRRDVPALYLHVDQLKVLPQPRTAITRFQVSVAVMFLAQSGYYATYATFDPANTESIEKACTWIKEFYVEELHQGEVVTDFDEVKPRFPEAVFALPKVMNGQLDPKQVIRVLGQEITDEHITIINNNIGGDYIKGDIKVMGGVSGDHNIIGHGGSQT